MKFISKKIICLFLASSILVNSSSYACQLSLNGQGLAGSEPGNIVNIFLNIIDIFNKDPDEIEDSLPRYRVVRVVDGDTIIVNIDGEDTRVRLIGVDCPESVHPDKNKNNIWGTMASDFTKLHLEDRIVGLELDEEEKDQYGRTLAYIYVDGEMFNKTLLENGLAKVTIYEPNDRYEDEFRDIEDEARENNIGLWAYENMDEESNGYKFIEIIKNLRRIIGLVSDIVGQ